MTEAESRDTRDRVIRMEQQLENLQKNFEGMKTEFNKLAEGQTQILEILTEARGMKRLFRWSLWLVGGLASTGGLWGYWPQIKAILFKVGS